jgi:hypothetical protein
MAASCLRETILSNCDFILDEYVDYSVISEADGSGFRAHVLARDQQSQQSAKFSSKTSATLEAALEDLHRSVAEAVAQRISEIGFAANPRLVEWRVPSKPGIPRPRPVRRYRRGSASSAGSGSSQEWQGFRLVDKEASETSSSDDSDSDSASYPPTPVPTGPRANRALVGDERDTAILRFFAKGPAVPPAPPVQASPRYPMVPPPPNSQQRRTCNFILCITLTGCGTIRVLDSCVPTVPILKARVATLTRDNIHKFMPMPSQVLSMFKTGLLAVALNRLVVGDTTIEIASFRDDVSFLCTGSNGCPTIEATVHRYGPKSAQHPPLPAARPAISSPSTHPAIRPAGSAPVDTLRHPDIQIVVPGPKVPNN